MRNKLNDMVDKKGWNEFRNTGLALIINQTLHIFGWALVFEVDEESGEVKNVYPARVKFRGFDNSDTDEAYKSVSKYMAENSDELLEETKH